MAPVVKKRKMIGFMKGNVYEGKPFTGIRWVEDKWDGLRGGIVINHDDNASTAFTLTGLPIPNAQHIIDEFVKCGKFDEMFIDGEFKGRNWNESQSIVKTQKPHPDAHSLRFHVFDMLPMADWEDRKSNLLLHERNSNLKFRLDQAFLPHVSYTTHTIVHTNEEILALRKDANARGLEGVMIKDPFAVYGFKKNGDWLKSKPTNEDDFVITGAKIGLGKHAGRLGAFEVVGSPSITTRQGYAGLTFEVGGGFTDAEREMYWSDYLLGKLLGRAVQIEFEIAEDIPVRNPVFIRMRDDKTL